VLRSVMRHGLKLTVVGLAAWLVGALVLTRLMETMLFEVRPSDPATLLIVAVTITSVAASPACSPLIAPHAWIRASC
jgi:putative ABC transport system permease protein